MKKNNTNGPNTCSFCGQKIADDVLLIHGFNGAICEDCADTVMEMVRDFRQKKRKKTDTGDSEGNVIEEEIVEEKDEIKYW